MSSITLKGNAVNTIGSLPSVGSTIKDFALVDSGLNVKTLETFEGKRKYLIFFQVLILRLAHHPQESLMKKLQL
jgi:thiol peroxidase